MLARRSARDGVVGATSLWANSLLLAACLMIGQVGTGNAAPLPPLPGFDPDTGVTYFEPDATVVGIELVDVLEPFTTFGFFFQSDPSTLIPIFDGTDLTSAGPQVAAIDFVIGLVLDIDAGVLVEAGFAPTADDIGFFLDVLGTTLFSDPLLNPGSVDLFSAFQNSADPALWGFVFEGINPDGSLSPISINLVANIASVPEPSAIALLAVGVLLVLVVARRRRAPD